MALTDTDIEKIISRLQGHVYVIENGHRVKIGRSRTPDARISALERQGGFSASKKYVSKPTTDWCEIELLAHASFCHRREMGEWFDLKFEEVVEYLESLEYREASEEDAIAWHIKNEESLEIFKDFIDENWGIKPKIVNGSTDEIRFYEETPESIVSTDSFYKHLILERLILIGTDDMPMDLLRQTIEASKLLFIRGSLFAEDIRMIAFAIAERETKKIADEDILHISREISTSCNSSFENIEAILQYEINQVGARSEGKLKEARA